MAKLLTISTVMLKLGEEQFHLKDIDAEKENSLWPSPWPHFCSIQVSNKLDEARPYWGKPSALLSLLTHI